MSAARKAGGAGKALALPLFAHCIIITVAVLSTPFETGDRDSDWTYRYCSAPSESDEHMCTHFGIAMVACNHGNVKTHSAFIQYFL